MNTRFPIRLKRIGAALWHAAVIFPGKTKKARYTSFGVVSILVMELSLVAFLLPKASASTAGPSPATSASGWTSSANAKACDSTNATNAIPSGTVGAQLTTTGYGFSIPSGSTIDGIQADITESANTAANNKIKDYTISLVIGGSVSGSNLATTAVWPTSLTDVTYGGSSNLWGLTPTVSQINASNFGLAVTAQNVSTGGSTQRKASVDCVEITVTYTAPASTYTQSNYRFYQNDDTVSGGGGGTPTLDTATLFNTASVTSSWTNNFTVAVNTNRYLIVSLDDVTCATPTGVTFNGTSMSLLGTVSANGTTGFCQWTYGLAAPDDSGSDPIVVSVPALKTGHYTMVASSWYGVDQTTPYGTYSSNFASSSSTSTASVSASSASGRVVLDFMANYTAGQSGSATPSGTQAAFTNDTSGNQIQAGASYTTASGSSTSMSWTGLVPKIPSSTYYWTDSAIDLNGGGGASTVDVGTPLAAQDTAISSPAEGTPFRLRLDVGVGSSDLAASGQDFELQYAVQSGGSCSATPAGNYANVSSSTPVGYYNDTNLTNGLALADANGVDPTESGTIISQEYLQDSTTTFTNPSAITDGEYGMWDFGLVMYHAIGGTTYCMRVADSTGGALDTYSQFPEITTPASTVAQSNFRFFANQDSLDVGSPLTTQNAVFDITKYDATGGTRKNLQAAPFRLRWNIGIGDSGEALSTSGSTGLVLRLEYAEMVGGSCTATASSGTWADVTTSTPIQFYTGNTTATNGGQPTSDANDPTDGSNSIVYETYSTQNYFNNAQSAVYAGQDGLWDFALIVSSSAFHSSYCLRVVHDSGGSDGSLVDTYSAYPQINIAPSMTQLMRGGSWWNSSGVREYKDL